MSSIWYMVDHGERGISGTNVTADWKHHVGRESRLNRVVDHQAWGMDGERSVYVEAATYDEARERAARLFAETPREVTS